jgi:hypothetical protein
MSGGAIARWFRSETAVYLPARERLKIALPAFAALLAAAVAARAWFAVDADTVLAGLFFGFLFCGAWILWRIERTGERVTREEYNRRWARDTLGLQPWQLGLRSIASALLAPAAILLVRLDWTGDLGVSLFRLMQSLVTVAFYVGPLVVPLFVWAVRAQRRSAERTLAEAAA